MEKLEPAVIEITSVPMDFKAVNDKDELVKQHMKIAEEAIAGWERAEAESAEMKEKFEALMEQKLATEDRVSHLDGALKECMKELRLVREEQEQKIHEAVVKKTSEWEKSISCTDMEVKLQHMEDELCVALEENRTLSKSLKESEEAIAELKDCKSKIVKDLEEQLRDTRLDISKAIADKMTLSKSLQQCEETMTELRDGKARVESENSRFRARLVAMEKENIRFKSELRTLSKDLELKINEDRVNKKSMQEIKKKMANLEDECQRLRALLTAKKKTSSDIFSKKPQGTEMPSCTDKLSRRRQSPCRSASSLSFKTDSDVNGDAELLSEVELDYGNVKGENRLLASKIVVVPHEEETRSFSHCSGKSEENSHRIQTNAASVSDDSTWASTGAPISDLGAKLRKDDSTSLSESLHTSLISLEIMDDFAEMEKLASLLDSPKDMDLEGEKKLHDLHRDSSSDDHVLDYLEKKTDHGKRGNVEVSEALEELCKHLKRKLEETESQLSSLQEKQALSNVTINHLEGLLAMKQGNEIMSQSKSIEVARLATVKDKKNVAEHGHGEIFRGIGSGEGLDVWSMTNSVSEINQPDKTLDISFCNNTGAELASAMRKVVEIVESFGQTDYNFPYSQWVSGPNNEHDDNDGDDDNHKKQWRSSGLDACVESLINLCNSLVQGKVDIIDFIAEIASALDWLVGLIFTPLKKSPSTNLSQRHNNNGQVDHKGLIDHSSDSDLTSAGNSPVQTMHNVSYLEDYKATESQSQDVVALDHSSVSNLSFQFSEASVQEDDISKLSCENGAIKSSLEAEPKKNGSCERENLRLKLVNDNLEHNHEITMEKLANLHSQVNEANQKIHKLTEELTESQKCLAELKAQLHEALHRKEFVENRFEELQCEKNALESEINKARENVEVLQRKAVNLEKELDEEIRCRKEAEVRYFELRKLLKEETRLSNSGSSSDDEGATLSKEQEIAAAAEKLSECQQTILDLGKQLKALGASKNLLGPHSSLPMLLQQKISSGEDSLLYERKWKDDNDDFKEAASCMSGREQRQDIMVMKPLKAPHCSAGYEEGDIRNRRQANGRYGRQTQSFDIYNSDNNNYNGSSNRFPSPIHCDVSQESVQSITSSSSDLSPIRSPSRFLSLRSKSNVNSCQEQVSCKYAENNENGEKHGSSSGLSRFFGRTRSGH